MFLREQSRMASNQLTCMKKIYCQYTAYIYTLNCTTLSSGVNLNVSIDFQLKFLIEILNFSIEIGKFTFANQISKQVFVGWIDSRIPSLWVVPNCSYCEGAVLFFLLNYVSLVLSEHWGYSYYNNCNKAWICTNFQEIPFKSVKFKCILLLATNDAFEWEVQVAAKLRGLEGLDR